MTDRTFDAFVTEVHSLLNGKAAAKQYSDAGPDAPNQLYSFVQHMAGGHGHALGEIVYKAKRYAARHDPEDVAKIAAWAFLVWKHHGEGPCTSST